MSPSGPDAPSATPQRRDSAATQVDQAGALAREGDEPDLASVTPPPSRAARNISSCIVQTTPGCARADASTGHVRSATAPDGSRRGEKPAVLSRLTTRSAGRPRHQRRGGTTTDVPPRHGRLLPAPAARPRAARSPGRAPLHPCRGEVLRHGGHQLVGRDRLGHLRRLEHEPTAVGDPVPVRRAPPRAAGQGDALEQPLGDEGADVSAGGVGVPPSSSARSPTVARLGVPARRDGPQDPGWAAGSSGRGIGPVRGDPAPDWFGAGWAAGVVFTCRV